MKKIISLLLLLCISFSLFAQTKIVRVGINLSRDAENGRYYGYEYEYFQEIAKYTGWQYGYVYSSKQNFEEWLESDAVDIIIDSSNVKDKKKFAASDQPVISYSSYIFKFQNDLSITSDDLSSLKDKRILVLRDSIPNKQLLNFKNETGIDFKIVYSDSSERIVRDFISGKSGADLLCAPDYYVKGFKGISSIQDLGTYEYCALLSKTNNELVKELNRAQHLLEDNNPYFQRQLKAKYFEFKNPITFKNYLEDDWLHSNDTVSVGYVSNCIPFCYTNSSGNADGVFPKYFAELVSKSPLQGKRINYVKYDSYDDALRGILKSEVNVIFPVYGDYYEAEIHNLQKTDNIIEITNDLVFKGSYSSNYIEEIVANREYQFLTRYAERYLQNYNFSNQTFASVKKLNDILNEPKTAILMDRVTADNLLSLARFSRYNRIELAEKCPLAMGVRRNDIGLLSLLNSSIRTLDSNYSLQLLNEISYKNKKYNFIDYMRDNMIFMFCSILAVVVVILFVLIIYIKTIQKNKAKLEKSKNQVDEALLIAENANKAKSVFLSNMSHDIRTPMNAIIGFTNLAQHSLDDKEKAKDYLSKIQVSSHHLLNLINDILDMSRIESGKLQLVEHRENLLSIAQEMKTILQTDMESHELEFIVDTTELKHPNVTCDKLRLNQILLNLLGNAIKFTPERGKVTFSIKESESEKIGKNKYYFIVEDSGIGMSQEFQKKIFEVFERENNSTISRTQGTGLGMAITKSLVDMMNGSIEIESVKCVGSKFTVQLELSATDELVSMETVKTEKKLPDYSKNVEISGSGLSVLVAEDNELNQEIAKSILEEMGFEVELVGNGAIAVEKIRENLSSKKYAILFMDIQMPILDGYEATKQIRSLESEYAKQIPIIAMTANAFDEDKKKALDCGMNSHITKPIDVKELEYSISNFLKKDR